MSLETFKALIRERSGLEFNGIAEKPLVDAIELRCKQPGLTTEGYLSKLKGCDQEFYELISLLTINETYFYREPEQISLFVQTLVPRLQGINPGKKPLYILSAGCSSGEEPYSLAMALLEAFGETAADNFVIIAGDIDKEALKKATVGQYRDYSFRSLSPQVRSRYFEPAGLEGLWQVKPLLRRMVRIEHLNLFAPPPPREISHFNAIFFRNVSIYFGLEKRRLIQELFLRLLHPQGILMIGIAETIANNLGVFSLVEEQGLFYFAKGSVPMPVPIPVPLTPIFVPAPMFLFEATPEPVFRIPSSPVPDLPGYLIMLRDKRLEEAKNQMESALQFHPGDQDLLLLLSFCHFQRKDWEGASALAKQVLELHQWSVDACVILGLVARQKGQGDQAITWLKQAVYDRNDCWQAQYYLGELYGAAGAPEKARRAYRSTLQLLGDAGSTPGGLRIIPLDLPQGEVRFLCEHQLGKLWP